MRCSEVLMVEFENNAYFWQKVDTLFLSGNLDLTKKKGDVHPEFKNMVYPTDYGHLGEVKSAGELGISIYAGSGNRRQVTALIIAADILTKELDVKMLIGCNDEETEDVLRFLNQTDFQKTVLMRRGSIVPSWGDTDN